MRRSVDHLLAIRAQIGLLAKWWACKQQQHGQKSYKLKSVASARLNL